MLIEDMWCSTVKIREELCDIRDVLSKLTKEIKHMSETLSQQVDDATAAIQGDVATLTTVVVAIQAEIAALQTTVVPGSTVTQEQADKLAALHTALAAQVTALQALEPAAPATPPATDPNAPPATA